MRATLIVLVVLGSMTGCGAPLGTEGEELTRGRSSNELAFAKEVKVGDIILTNTSAERGCWYLSKAENWYTNPRFCHAALVVESSR